MVYKICLVPLNRRFDCGDCKSAVWVTFESDSLPGDVDFFCNLAARRMLLDFLRVCGYQLSDFHISTIMRSDP